MVILLEKLFLRKIFYSMYLSGYWKAYSDTDVTVACKQKEG